MISWCASGGASRTKGIARPARCCDDDGETQAPAFASPSPCISTLGHSAAGIGGTGSSSGCQYLVTVNANGGITLQIRSGTYGSNDESNEDVEVGVIDNDTGGTLSGRHLTGRGIGNFEGDGIDAYGATGNSQDTTG